ncbi:MAG: HAD family hydrolase, partial [Candidatus Mariimomonas ferrooxydans]
AETHNTIVVSEAKTCKEKPGAKKTLDFLGRRFPLYLSSTTPEAALREIVKDRKWDTCFCDIFGYPREKANTLLEVMKKEQVNADEVLVVGDGESDRLSASETGCRFFYIEPNNMLENLLLAIKNV